MGSGRGQEEKGDRKKEERRGRGRKKKKEKEGNKMRIPELCEGRDFHLFWFTDIFPTYRILPSPLLVLK